MAFWAWVGASILVAAASLAFGGETGAVFSALTLTLAPALSGLALLSKLENSYTAALAVILAWLAMGVGLAAGAGGALSPLAAGLALGPALTALIAPRWFTMIAVVAVLAYPLSAGLGRLYGPAQGLGPFAELQAAAALTFAGALIGIGLNRATRVEAAPAAAVEEKLAQRIAEVSHELRTPLNHIIGFADAIAAQVFGPAGARNVEYAGLIGASGRQLLDLVNDLLDLSRFDAGRFDLEIEDVDVAGLVREAAALAQASAAARRIVLEALTPEVLWARADARALRRVATNLIGNALKFTPEGGRVTVTARSEGRMFVIDVADTGAGIPEAERTRLGAAFERGRSGLGVEGAGLGLSYVRAIAHAHGGTLSFHDAEGGGALVRVTAPLNGG